MKQRTTAILITAVSLAMIGAWLASFFIIRSRAMEDYSLRQQGQQHRHAERLGTLIRDGGSTIYEGWGYRVCDMNQAGPQPGDGTPVQRIKGPKLEFTCRAWFPVLQRWLVDQKELRVE